MITPPKISNFLTKIEELNGIIYSIVPYYNVFILEYKLRYYKDGGLYYFQYIQRFSDHDEIKIGTTTESEVIADLDLLQHNEKIPLQSFRETGNSFTDIGNIILINEGTLRTRYGFQIWNGWDNLKRITVIKKKDFLFKLDGWIPLHEDRKPINDMIREMRVENLDVEIGLEDVIPYLCESGLNEFLEKNPEYRERKVNPEQLLSFYGGPESKLAILEAKRRYFDKNLRKPD